MTTQLHIAVRDGRKAVIPTERPVIFTAGPIRNGPIWQNQAMRDIIEAASDYPHDIFVASPLRDGEDGFADDLVPYLAPFAGSENFPRQRAWERYYLNQAAEDGCVLFWLAAPLPREEWSWPEKSYAQITMLELGYWLREAEENPLLNLVIGADPGFPELSTVSYEIKTVLGENFIIRDSLLSTASEAVRVAMSYR